MLRGIYIAASGLSGRQQAIDVLSNNLANIDTTGYKADQIASRSFGAMLLSRIADQTPGPSGKAETPPLVGNAQLSGGATESHYIDFSGGSITITDNPLDLALEGPGFFVLDDGDGNIAYTRDGSFTVDMSDNLVTQSGKFVLDSVENQIRILNDGPIAIDPDGSISIGGLPAGKIGIAEFTDLSVLSKAGENTFTTSGLNQYLPGTETRVIQGAIERSNVNSVSALTQLMARFREFEAAARSLDIIDRTLDKTVNEMSRVNV